MDWGAKTLNSLFYGNWKTSQGWDSSGAASPAREALGEVDVEIVKLEQEKPGITANTSVT